MSLAAYVLTGCWRRSLRSIEAPSSNFLMRVRDGFWSRQALSMAHRGELSYVGIAGKVRGGQEPGLLSRRVLHLVALAFKVAACRFTCGRPTLTRRPRR